MNYPGGKNGMGIYQRIINLMPPHDRYVELFLGSGAVMRHKRPANVNIGIDRDLAALGIYRSAIGGCDDDRSRIVRLMNIDGLDMVETGNLSKTDERTLIYADPPYVHSTRTKDNIYKFEMTNAEHLRLLKALERCGAMVMLSGYKCELYLDELKDWNRIDYMAQTRGGLKEESLWFNFKEPTELHDYSFLGADFRERERIKRKKQRWVSRLAKLNRMERQALLAAIGEMN